MYGHILRQVTLLIFGSHSAFIRVRISAQLRKGSETILSYGPRAVKIDLGGLHLLALVHVELTIYKGNHKLAINVATSNPFALVPRCLAYNFNVLLTHLAFEHFNFRIDLQDSSLLKIDLFLNLSLPVLCDGILHGLLLACHQKDRLVLH